MSNANDQNRRVSHWTDDSGILHQIVWMRCPRCQLEQMEDNYDAHLSSCSSAERQYFAPQKVEKRHIEATPKNKRLLVDCVECGAHVRSDRLQKHLRERCKKSQTNRSIAKTQSKVQTKKKPAKPRDTAQATSTTKKKTSPQANKTKADKKDSLSSPQPGSYTGEAFRQSFDEPHDGSKHWGSMRREHGRFGSHPLIDDYGDESKP